MHTKMLSKDREKKRVKKSEGRRGKTRGAQEKHRPRKNEEQIFEIELK